MPYDPSITIYFNKHTQAPIILHLHYFGSSLIDSLILFLPLIHPPCCCQTNPSRIKMNFCCYLWPKMTKSFSLLSIDLQFGHTLKFHNSIPCSSLTTLFTPPSMGSTIPPLDQKCPSFHITLIKPYFFFKTHFFNEVISHSTYSLRLMPFNILVRLMACWLLRL